MKRKTAKKLLIMLIVLLVCITQLSLTPIAVSLDAKGSITLSTFSKESRVPISGAVFRLYHFASAQTGWEGLNFEYTDDFSSNGMDIRDLTDSYLPAHLAAYAESYSLVFTEKSTDGTGSLSFDNLSVGAYLVVPVSIDEEYLTPAPFIVCVPMKDETQNKWIYNVDATPKIEIDYDVTDETYISVKKLWEGSDTFPESITAALVKDGVVIDTIELSAQNNWYHKWEKLDANHSWNVVEVNVPAGYEVSYEASQMTVIITNTADEEDTTDPEETTLPDETTTGEELIDTGQLNWPIPTFAIAGLLIFSAGWILLNFDKKDEKTE